MLTDNQAISRGLVTQTVTEIPQLMAHYCKALYQSAIDNNVQLPREAVASDDDWQPAHYAILIREISRQLNDELMGFTEDTVTPGAFTLFIELISHEPTLGRALEKLAALYSVATNSMKFKLSVEDDVAVWSMQMSSPDSDRQCYLREGMSRGIHRLSCYLLGEEIHLQEVHFIHAANSTSIEYTRMFHCPVLFDQTQQSISFKAHYLDRPMLRGPDDLEHLWEAVRLGVDCVTIPGNTSICEAVRAEVRRSFLSSQHFPTLDELAVRFCKSPQTLRRRLKDEGVRYVDLKEDIRKAVVVQWLENPSIPLKQVADIGGFAEPAGLSRAVKHWFGVSPSEYRRRFADLAKIASSVD